MSKKNNKATQWKGLELDQAFSITKFRYHIFNPGNEPDTRTDQTFLAAILRPDKTECGKRVFVFNIISLMKKKTYFGPLFETGLSQSEKDAHTAISAHNHDNRNKKNSNNSTRQHNAAR